MKGQLVFDLAFPPARAREDFLVAPCNRGAASWIDRWPDWPGGVLILVGPAGSGKSHLAEVWRGRAGVPVLDPLAPGTAEVLVPETNLLIETAEAAAGGAVAERRLFHLVNAVREAGRSLLVTARQPPARWPLRLPDLASRLTSCPLARIAPPDDEVLAAVLVKLFSDRQVRVEPRVIAYLASHMERSFAEARRLVARLDARALAGGQAITVPLARGVLGETIDSEAAAAGDGEDDENKAGD